jgi:hypothetical protein
MKFTISILVMISLSAIASSKRDLYLEMKSLSINCQSNDIICSGDKVLNGNSSREVELVDNTGRVVLKENGPYPVLFET